MSQQSKHTQGPWLAHDFKTHIGVSGRKKDTMFCGVVCRIKNEVSKEPLTEEDYANARLIAAAPDLLEALETVLNAHDYDGALTTGDAMLSPSIRARVESAINKAKGE